MSEGKDVREAFDGPQIEHDAFISQLLERNREQTARSSDASESAAKAKEFIEETGLNSKVFGWSKQVLKTLDKKDGQHKAMDIIRSMEAVVGPLRDHVAGQGTLEMDIEGPSSGDADDTVTPIDFGGGEVAAE